MMKRSLDLATEMGVDLRGVLTWAFTFPGTPYFAGYRALSTNGIHLPVLNAFKLLARLDGERLPATSSGARPLGELLESGVREQADVDVLATSDGERLQILVWNYHDDLVEAEPASVTVNVTVPSVFEDSAALTHHRVDDQHGNAFTVWQAQGKPSAPTSAELASLHQAMDALEFEPERVVAVRDGAVTVSFDLPRFGVSLITLTPSSSRDARTPSEDDAGCSCRMSPEPGAPLSLWMSGLLTAALAGRRLTGFNAQLPLASARDPRGHASSKGRA
jgi:xylan 1,4-beta-xylosidase